MKSTENNKIPSEADFERAKKIQREMDSHFKRIRENILGAFGDAIPIHEIFIFPDTDTNYSVVVFMNTNADVQQHTNAEMGPKLRKAFEEEFDKWNSSTCDVTFDSHENVKRISNGNYLQYLR